MPFRDVLTHLAKIYFDVCGTSCNTLLGASQSALYLTHRSLAQCAVDPSLLKFCISDAFILAWLQAQSLCAELFFINNKPFCIKTSHTLLTCFCTCQAVIWLLINYNILSCPTQFPPIFQFSPVSESFLLQALRIILCISLDYSLSALFFLQRPELFVANTKHICPPHGLSGTCPSTSLSGERT